MEPTAWWKHVPEPGGPTVSVARWYWPEATRVEVNNGNGEGWVDRPVFLDLHDDPGWEESTEADAEAWLASNETTS
jgi:hypothetical protein